MFDTYTIEVTVDKICYRPYDSIKERDRMNVVGRSNLTIKAFINSMILLIIKF